jgi:hypothetical protein
VVCFRKTAYCIGNMGNRKCLKVMLLREWNCRRPDHTESLRWSRFDPGDIRIILTAEHYTPQESYKIITNRFIDVISRGISTYDWTLTSLLTTLVWYDWLRYWLNLSRKHPRPVRASTYVRTHPAEEQVGECGLGQVCSAARIHWPQLNTRSVRIKKKKKH